MHEHVDVERDVEMSAEIGYALGFRLAAAVGEEDERDAVSLEVAEGGGSSGKRGGAAEEDAIDAVRVS